MNKERLDELEKLAEAAIKELSTRPPVAFGGRDYQRTEMVPCSSGLSRQLADAVPELLEAVKERDAEIERLKKELQREKNQVAALEPLRQQHMDMRILRSRCAELEADNKSAVEKLAASVEAGAKLMEEKNVLANRCAALEKVREAAEALFNEIERMADGNDWPWDLGDIGDALDAAMAAARGE